MEHKNVDINEELVKEMRRISAQHINKHGMRKMRNSELEKLFQDNS